MRRHQKQTSGCWRDDESWFSFQRFSLPYLVADTRPLSSKIGHPNTAYRLALGSLGCCDQSEQYVSISAEVPLHVHFVFPTNCVFHRDHSIGRRVPAFFFLRNPSQASIACHELQIHHDCCDGSWVHDSQWSPSSVQGKNSGCLLLHCLGESRQLFQRALRISQFGRLVMKIFGPV